MGAAGRGDDPAEAGTPVTEEPPPWLAALGRPLVYVTLGTVVSEPTLFRSLLDGLAGLDGVAALVTTGKADPAALGSVPAGIRLERFVPQAAVLPRADAAVTHGGSGSTLGVLAHGVPLVLVPHAADQFDNAARAAAAGAAVVLQPDEVTPAAVAESLRRVLTEPDVRAGAASVAAEIQAMPGPDEAAGAIEEHLGRS